MTTDKLRQVHLFAGLDEAVLERISALATEFTAPEGQVLIETGQAGTGIFLIEEGSVRVDLPEGGSRVRGPGTFFGELAVLTDSPRVARVVVDEPLTALAIRRTDLLALLEEEPTIALSMLRELARRLTEA
ncbi:MAG TPA: cyclic nucleotide-binding domain-containing protein [Acidimicrobiia bacterium]|nr:cyclic nucleotide-binding domain-containing protein [Acidimicrobiia bacterium]